MRALLFVHCFYPGHIYGTEAYTLALAKGLQARSHDVRVISATLQGEDPQSRFVVDYEWDGVPVTSYDKNLIPHVDIRGTYLQPEMRPYHERLLRHFKPDVVHVCHTLSHTAAIYDVCAALGIPTFGTLTDFFGICLNNKLQAADDTMCAGPNADRSNCVACQLRAMSDQRAPSTAFLKGDSGAIAKVAMAIASGERDSHSEFGFDARHIQDRPGFLAERYGNAIIEMIAPSTFLLNSYRDNCFPVRMRLSHFGIDIDRSSKPPADGRRSPLRIGYVGQIARHKGTHILMEALTLLPRNAFTASIWGPVNQDPVYVTLLQQLAADMNVTFEGTFSVDRTATILGQLDLLVIPSIWYENSPLILLQALATHTPCVVSDVLGLTEFVCDGVSGFSFKIGDAESLAEVLMKFVDDPLLAFQLSATTSYGRTMQDMVDDAVKMYRDGGVPA